MSQLPIEIQLDSLEEESPKSTRLEWKDLDRLGYENDYFVSWLRLINPRIDAYASTQEYLLLLKLDERNLEDLGL